MGPMTAYIENAFSTSRPRARNRPCKSDAYRGIIDHEKSYDLTEALLDNVYTALA